MGNIFCKDSPEDSKDPRRHDLKSAMILERFEQNVLDDYEYVEKLGEGSISTVSSIRRRDRNIPKKNICFGFQRIDHRLNNQPKRNDICFGFVDISAFVPKKDIILDNIDSSSNSRKNYKEKIFALKEIDLRLICKENTDELRNEIKILRSLDHPNIAKAYETYEYKRKLFLVMEFCSGGNLKSRVPYTEKESCQLIRKILLAVGYMHKTGIVHRDLKFENIMFESNKPDAEIKIIDFGLSKKFLLLPDHDNEFTEKVGTLYTMAPEVIAGRYSTKVDLWSIGVIAYMLLSTQKPFWGINRKEVVKSIMKCNYNFNYYRWNNISKDAKSFVHNLLKLQPEERSTIGEALESNWMTANEPTKERITNVISNSFIHFSHNAEIKKLALAIIAHRSTADDIFKLRQMFESLDATKSGCIAFEEFKQAFSKHQYSEKDLMAMFDSVDTFGDGHINYTEFLAATMENQGEIDEERLAEVFQCLDCDESGFISKEDLKIFLSKTYSEEFIDQLIAEVDTNNDKQISFQEFLTAFKCRT